MVIFDPDHETTKKQRVVIKRRHSETGATTTTLAGRPPLKRRASFSSIGFPKRVHLDQQAAQLEIQRLQWEALEKARRLSAYKYQGRWYIGHVKRKKEYAFKITASPENPRSEWIVTFF